MRKRTPEDLEARGPLDRLVKWTRHPLRAVVASVAVVSVVGSFAGVAGIASALLGTLAGLLLGELLGRAERVRAPALLVLLMAVAVVGGAVARGLVAWPIAPRILGPATTLALREALVLGTVALSTIAGLRILALRRPAWRFVEIAALSAAFVAAFAAHRGGSVARPLWLSDWAWRSGYDPANVLLAIGAAFGVACGALLLLESRHRLSALTVAVLPLLAIVVLSVVDPRDLGADAATDLQAIQDALPTGNSQEIEQEIPVVIGHGDPPKPTGPGILDGPGQGDGSIGSADGDGGGAGAADGDPVDGDGQADAAGSSEGASGDGDASGREPEEGGGADAGDGTAEGGGEQEGPDSSAGQGEDGAAGQPDDAQGDGAADGQLPDGQAERGEGQASDGAGESGQGDPRDGAGDGAGSDELREAQQPEMEFEGGDRQGGGASVAAVVVFRDDYRTPSGYYYFRQQAHSAFTGSRMVPTHRPDADLDVMWDFPTRIGPVEEPPPWPLRTRVRGKVALLGEHDGPFALESPALFLPTTNPNPDRFVTAYAFESYAQETPYEQLVGRRAGDPDWSDDLRDYYLTAPADPRYRELVDRILGELPEHARSDPFTRALAIKVWLDANMKYSLTRRYPEADDPTAEFLFGDDEIVGYCVHSAHAAVYLWRLAGIPARVGTGYLVDESARRGSSLLVMGSDAHAWPELYLEGVGWLPMDISPAENLDPPGQPVDSEMTAILGEMVREAEIEPEAEGEPIRFGLWLRRLALFTAASLVLLTLSGHYVVKVWRRARPYLATPAGLPRVGYRAALDRLAEAGWVRAEGETREAFARRVAEVAPAFVVLTELHVAHAFNDPSRHAGETPEVWREALAELDRQLPAAAPWWRRALGLLDPTSIYRAR